MQFHIVAGNQIANEDETFIISCNTSEGPWIWDIFEILGEEGAVQFKGKAKSLFAAQEMIQAIEALTQKTGA